MWVTSIAVNTIYREEASEIIKDVRQISVREAEELIENYYPENVQEGIMK